MNVCWGISTGAYSDYRVLCICPSKEDAEILLERIVATDSWYSNAQVEYFYAADRGLEAVTILSMSENLWDDGTATDYCEWTETDFPFDSLTDYVSVQWRWVRAPVHRGAGGRLEVSGVDHEAVRRVFSDRKAQVRGEDAFRLKKEAKGRK